MRWDGQEVGMTPASGYLKIDYLEVPSFLPFSTFLTSAYATSSSQWRWPQHIAAVQVLQPKLHQMRLCSPT